MGYIYYMRCYFCAHSKGYMFNIDDPLQGHSTYMSDEQITYLKKIRQNGNITGEMQHSNIKK